MTLCVSALAYLKFNIFLQSETGSANNSQARRGGSWHCIDYVVWFLVERDGNYENKKSVNSNRIMRIEMAGYGCFHIIGTATPLDRLV